jgi:glycolate oxidase FAD binding subunit
MVTATREDTLEKSFRPVSEEQVRDTVAWAVSETAPLEIVGHGSKRALGRPMQTAATLDLSDLTGVTLYEPEELVLAAKAGTPLAELEALLAERNQEFQFEPMDYGPLLGEAPGRGTIGGMLSTNLAGPRRLKVGAARDHVLGIRCVTGRGEVIKSGGRVVKNVTGYDLSKGLAGAWGTLGVLTEVTMKVMPRPQTETTIVVAGLDDAAGTEAMAAALGSSAEVASAAHLPESVRGRVLERAFTKAATVLRLEGFAPSVDYRFEKLAALLSPYGAVERLDADLSRRLWREIRDVTPFADGTMRPVWRVSVAPMTGYQLVATLRLKLGVDAFYDWQGGLVWLRMEAGPDAEFLRATIKALGGGHATLVRAAPELRDTVPVFEPQPGPLAALSMRLKEQFDPAGILNPGRMG